MGRKHTQAPREIVAGCALAITTRLLEPTETCQARIIARCESERLVMTLGSALEAAGAGDQDGRGARISLAHAVAALRLHEQLGRGELYKLVMASSGQDSYVFLSIPLSRSG